MTPSDVVTPETDTAYAMQMASDMSQIATGFSDIQRLNDTTEVIGDVSRYGGAIQSATVTELFLVEATARASVAGTAIPVDTLTVGLESRVGRSISMESFTDYMVTLYRAIAALIKRIWDAIASFFKMVLGSIPRMRWAIGQLQKRIRECKTEFRIPESMELDLPLLSLSAKDKLPKFTGDLIKTVDMLNDHVRYYLGDYTTLAVPAFETVVYELERFNESDPVMTLNALSTAAYPLATRLQPPGLTLEHVGADSRHVGADWRRGPPLPKDQSMFLRIRRVPETIDPLGRAAAIQESMVTFATTKPNSNQSSDRTGFMASPTLADLDKLCVMMLNMCDSVVAYNTAYGTIEGYKNRMLQASKDMVERTRELDPSDNDLPYYRAAMRYNTYLTMAVVQPCTHLVNMVMSVNRSLLILGNRVLDTTH